MKYASVAIMPFHDLKNLRTILIFVFLVSLDLVSKYLVFNYIDLYQFIKITPFFDITHIHNFGVSFGLFSGTISPIFNYNWFVGSSFDYLSFSKRSR